MKGKYVAIAFITVAIAIIMLSVAIVDRQSVKAGIFVDEHEVVKGEIVTLEQTGFRGELFDSYGRLVKAFSGEIFNTNHIVRRVYFEDRMCEIDTSDLEPGTYYVNEEKLGENYLYFAKKMHYEDPVVIHFHDLISTDESATNKTYSIEDMYTLEAFFEKMFGCDFELEYDSYEVNYVSTFGEPIEEGNYSISFAKRNVQDYCLSLERVERSEGMAHLFYLAMESMMIDGDRKRLNYPDHSPILITANRGPNHSSWGHEYLHQIGIGHHYLDREPFYSTNDYEDSLSTGFDCIMSTLGYVPSDDSKVKNRVLCPLLRYAFEPNKQKKEPYTDDRIFAKEYNYIREKGSWMLSENFPPRKPMVHIDIDEMSDSAITLKCLAGASFDHEGDYIKCYFQWYKNGIKQEGLTNETITVLVED